MRRFNSTHKRVLTILRPGSVDSQVSIAMLCKIRLEVVEVVIRQLMRGGYVVKGEQGYALSAKGRTLALSLTKQQR